VRSQPAALSTLKKRLPLFHERLTKEIDFWQDRWMKLKDDLAAGKDVRLNLENHTAHHL